MSHSLLAQYPTLYGQFLFLNAYCISKNLYPLLDSPPLAPTTPGTIDPFMWAFYNGFSKDYLAAAEDDFLFVRDGIRCEEEHMADQMYFRTSLFGIDGRPVWLRASLNRSQKSRWFSDSFTLEPEKLCDRPPIESLAAPIAPAPSPEIEAINATLPLTKRYPKFSELVFLHHDKISERLIRLTADTTLTWQKVQSFLNDQYQKEGLNACRFTQNGKDASPETADTFYFTTGYMTPDGKEIFLQCERNNGKHTEPWFGKFFNSSSHKDIGSLTLFRMLRIFDSQVDHLDYFHPIDLDPSSSPKDRSAQIAKCYEERKEVHYYRDCLLVMDENSADQMILPSGFHTKDGEEIMLRCKRNSRLGLQPWVSRRFFLPSQNAFQGKKLNKWLTSWASFQAMKPFDLSKVLPLLKEMAMDELWSFYEKDDLSILRNYLTYTFVRLWREGKVKETDGFAAFNTGLVNNTYEYIYALFCPSRSEKSDGRKWQFLGFCLANEDRLGKELARNFFPLPQPARYFDPKSPIYYCFNDNWSAKEQKPGYDADHVLLERTERLPIPFLRRFSHLLCGIGEKLDQLEALGSQEDTASTKHVLWSEVSKMIRGNDSAYREMRNSLDKALEMAVRRAAWNYRTTVPYYDPTQNKICLLLPISLASENGAPDVAMVLEPIVNRQDPQAPIHYMGHTIITLAMAYSNSRLVCRPESDWLNMKAVQDTSSASSDDFDEDGEDGSSGDFC